MQEEDKNIDISYKTTNYSLNSFETEQEMSHLTSNKEIETVENLISKN